MKERINEFKSYLMYEKMFSSNTVNSYVRDLEEFNSFLHKDSSFLRLLRVFIEVILLTADPLLIRLPAFHNFK